MSVVFHPPEGKAGELAVRRDAGHSGTGLRRQVVVIGAAVALGTVIVLFTVVNAFGTLERATEARLSATAVLTWEERAQRAVLDMETGLRGYLLTGRLRFLEPWNSGRANFERSVTRLEALERSLRPGGRAAVAEIGRLGRDYIAGHGVPIVRGDPRSLDADDAADRAEEGKRRVDELRTIFASYTAGATRRSNERLEAVSRARSRARAVAVGGLSLVLLLVGSSMVYLLRWTQNRRLEAARDRTQTIARELAAQEDLAVDLVATIGFDGFFKRVNPAWERTLGHAPEEIMSRRIVDFVHAQDVERTEAELVRVSAAGAEDTIGFENRCRTKHGDYRWLEWNVRPIAEQKLLYAVARDVTDRKQADCEIRAAQATAERANQAKSEFLSRMSHELRTPLNAILGFGQLLEMDDPQGSQRQSVDQILRGGRHLLALIDEVLDISRIEAGTMRMSLEPVDVDSAVGDVVSLIAPVADDADIEVRFDRCSGEHCYVAADRQRLRQVILNLLSNAVKYNSPGGNVRVTIVPSDERVRIEVADSGQGIPVEHLDRLFVAFDRLDADGGAVQGTGLGLALSRSLAEEMQGQLLVQSTEGEGSVFTLELERAANPIDEDTLAGARRASREAPVSGACTILYIEDNAANAALVAQAFFSQPSVRLLEAMQGSTGLELARAHRPDLILLDLDLPDVDGVTVLARLKADPVTNPIPVIVISAEATPRVIRALMAAGVAACLTKPLDVTDFLRVVEQHLAKEVA